MAQTSRISDLFRAVRAIFAVVSPSTTVQFCERYVAQEGAANRIVIVPTDGALSGPVKLSAGHVAGCQLGATAHIWGASPAPTEAAPSTPTQSEIDELDLERSDAADGLLDLLINALERAAPGRAQATSIERVAGVNLENYGEAYRVKIGFLRGIPKIAAVANLAADQYDPPTPPNAAIPNSPPDPTRVPGAPVLGVGTDVTSEPH